METESRLVESLNPQQREAVRHTGGPCLVLAGAGSGKTRVITHRIAWLIREQGVGPAAVCAVTFTNKAAAEMRERVHALLGEEPEELWVLTFHALGLRLLRRAAGRDGAPPSRFSVLDRSDALSIWRECQQALDIDPSEHPPASLFELCSRAVNRLEDPRGWDTRGRPTEMRLASRIYGDYRDALRRRRALDFDQLLLWPLRLLQADDELRAEVRGRFRHLLIDEYQDTNRLQYRLVQTLLGPDSALMVVGDEDQSIYRWRGADLANVLDFQRDFPDATVIRLEQNYRSTAPILAAAGSLVSHNRERLGKELWTEAEGGDKPLFMLCGSERQEAIWVAKQIGPAVQDGVPHRSIAVLYRTNAQSRAFEEELAGRGIPFRVVGGPTFFRRAEVKDLLSWLRLLVTDDAVALARAAATPSRGVGSATLAALAEGDVPAPRRLREIIESEDPETRIRELGVVGRAVPGLLDLGRTLAALREKLGERSLPELLEDILDRSGYRKMLQSARDGEDRLANLDEVVASAAEMSADEPAVPELITRYLDRAALISDADTSAGSDGVSLMTVHAAKGLEFHTVLLSGLEEGLLPHAGAIRDGQVEEERRLCYVAMTRARQRLFLSAARLRRVHGKERFQQLSRFVSEIDPRTIVRREEPSEVVAAGQRTAGRGAGRRRGSGRRSADKTAAPTRRGRRGAPAKPVAPDAKGTGEPAAPEDLEAGVGVFHPMFGPGRITATEGSGDKLKLTVAFARAGRKQLLARFAKLQLLA